jgi:hypothetical protein
MISLHIRGSYLELGLAILCSSRHDGLEDVQLQLAGLGCHRDAQILADHLEGDLVDRLGDDRVDLRHACQPDKFRE